MLFWIITCSISGLVGLILGLTLFRGRKERFPTATYDTNIYRDQLQEVERDLERGNLDLESAERLRNEISRRILAANSRPTLSEVDTHPQRSTAIFTPIALSFVLIFCSIGVYLYVGAPGYGDLGLAHRLELAEQARAVRPSQSVAENSLPQNTQKPQTSADFLDLMEKLRQAVKERPNDLEGHILLARNEAALGNFRAGHQAKRRVLELKGLQSTTHDWSYYAELLILAAGGYVSPEAEAALQRALQLDEHNGTARYYTGLMYSQIGRPDRAFSIWQNQLRNGPADAPWIEPIRVQIEETALRAGVNNFTLPSNLLVPSPVPDEAGVAAEMTPAERIEMINNMVSGLEQRLQSEGGSTEEWLRLIRSLIVLDRNAAANAALSDALAVFASDEAASRVLLEGVRELGLRP
ncbi:MAG: c-type cytochrome biogenesis protein CcmI [Aestuariivita sp.]|nr:c-type cytochrome biogenesis protein CcmI [Aestuariivita sp.]MCY4203682.1 c-type cytochrome biogenesis protein CcmI [Aestuariivita sp.]MCY4287014.1 c-type cytochrome biogenesis protein CcmI [Aestuariivita sp.]MCY4347661.1 c-type cytochrome biogenesis protein CcmI [Aestuariivita sp.]